MSKTASNSPPIEKVFTDKNGVEWYAYKNPLSSPFLRMAAIESARAYEELKVTRERFIAFLDNQIEFYNKQDWAALAAGLFDMRARAMLKVEEETMLTIASGFFFTKQEYEEEQHQRFNNHQQAAKIEYWRDNPDCYDFFLETCAKELMGFTDLSARDLATYFNMAEKVIAQNKAELLSPQTPSKKSSTSGTTWSTTSRKAPSQKASEPKA